jgi:hypothetical protein
MDGYIAKPINVAELLAVIDKLMGQFPTQTTAAPATPVPAAPAAAVAQPAFPQCTPAPAAALSTLMAGCLADPALTIQIVQQFQDQLAQAMAGLEQAHRDGDLEVLNRLAQSLKAPTADAAAAAVAHVAAELERLAADSEPMAEALAHLRTQVAQSLQGLRPQVGTTVPSSTPPQSKPAGSN